MAFDVVYMHEEAAVPLHVSICGHRNPEHIFIDELSRHANTAVALQEIHVVAADCAAAAGRCAVLFGAIPQRHNGGLTVDAGDVSIHFVEPSQAPAPGSSQGGRDAPAGVCFQVASLAAAEAVLLRNGVANQRIGSRLVVSSASAGGCEVQFDQRKPA